MPLHYYYQILCLNNKKSFVEGDDRFAFIHWFVRREAFAHYFWVNKLNAHHPIKMSKIIKTNLPELRHTASTRKRNEKIEWLFCSSGTNGSCFSFSIQKKSPTAQWLPSAPWFIYVANGWWTFGANIHFILHWLTNGMHGIPFARAHFIFHSIYVYAIQSSTNYMFATVRIYSVPSTLIMLRQAGFQDECLQANMQAQSTELRSHGCCLMHCQFILEQNIALDAKENLALSSHSLSVRANAVSI